ASPPPSGKARWPSTSSTATSRPPDGHRMDVTELSAIPLFDGLSDEQLSALVESGEEVRFEPGDELWHDGRPADHWWVLLEGHVPAPRRNGREETVLGRISTPGQWAGGFRAWDGDGVYLATGRATTSGRMLCVPSEVLRALVDAVPLVSHVLEGVFRTARNIE